MENKPHQQLKNVLIGLGLGFSANGLGLVVYVWIFSPLGLKATLSTAFSSGYLGAIIGLGALLNLLLFFGFLKLKKDQEAKGVVVATIIAAVFILVLKTMGL